MPPPLIQPLTSLTPADAASFGPKAVNLGRLARAGLPVPAGFCITGDAYRAHAERALGADGPDALADIRRAIIETPVSDELAGLLEEHLRDLGAGPVAVRSSGTAEDLPDASFAGQHDTVLGVVGRDACLHAVRRCWASLWSDRAEKYRRRKSVDGADAAMAVIVQTLVPADASGVLFTADPLTGQVDRMVIEGAYGLGETIVSGRVSPDRFVVARTAYRIRSREIGRKAEAIVVMPGGVVTRPVDDERMSRPCLDDPQVQAVAELGVAAEEVLGGTLDVEWAIAGGALHLLQARPITTAPGVRSWEDRQVWTNANAAEVLPDVLSPMTASHIEPLVYEIFGQVGDWIGLELRDVTLINVIAGRAYFNLNTFLGMLHSIPGLRHRSLPDLLGGQHVAMNELGDLDIPEEDVPDLRVHWGRRIVGVPKLLVSFLTHAPSRGERYMERMAEQTEAMYRVPWRSMSDDEIHAHTLDIARTIMGDDTDGIIYVGVGMVWSLSLYNVCRRWFGEEEGDGLASRLLAGLGTMENAQAGLAFWRLASAAHDDSEVLAAIRSGDGFEQIEPRLRGTGFMKQWETLMWRHGHHTRGEVEVANARWSEQPDYVLKMLRSFVDERERTDPIARESELSRKREEIAGDCRRRLGPVRRRVFGFILARALRGAPIRENLKSQLVRRLALIRSMLLELGFRMTDRGTLSHRDDVFYLRSEELGAALKGALDDRATAIVADRRAAEERYRAIRPPAVIFGRFDPDDFTPHEIDRDATVLNGVAVSPGVIEGRARVILHAGDDHVRPGEILVAPFTDPGWSPYFLNAAAIVMDLGGLLSHGSIIAREYGIPCVVNVGPATEIVKTGQRLRVDGNRGVVELVGEGTEGLRD